MIVLNPMLAVPPAGFALQFVITAHTHTHAYRDTHAWTNGMPLATIFVKILQYFVLYAERDASPSELQAALPCKLATSAWSSFFVEQKMLQYV